MKKIKVRYEIEEYDCVTEEEFDDDETQEEIESQLENLAHDWAKRNVRCYFTILDETNE